MFGFKTTLINFNLQRVIVHVLIFATNSFPRYVYIKHDGSRTRSFKYKTYFIIYGEI